MRKLVVFDPSRLVAGGSGDLSLWLLLTVYGYGVLLVSILSKRRTGRPVGPVDSGLRWGAICGLLILAPLTYLAHHLWGPVGFLLVLLPFVRRPFDRAVEKVTGGYAAILRRIVTRRTVSMAVVGAFAVGTFYVNTKLPSGFIPAYTALAFPVSPVSDADRPIL